jgi:hypothetical protein
MGRSTGLEPANAGATIQCVDQLHHDRHSAITIVQYQKLKVKYLINFTIF